MNTWRALLDAFGFVQPRHPLTVCQLLIDNGADVNVEQRESSAMSASLSLALAVVAHQNSECSLFYSFGGVIDLRAGGIELHGIEAELHTCLHVVARGAWRRGRAA